MQRVMPGGFHLKIGDTIEYAKKPGKMQLVKVLKDAPTQADFYKSGAVHTQAGEPPSSVSRPTPKGKPVPPRPITKGKLIKPGGPGGRPSRNTNNRAAQSRPSAASSRPVPAARPTPAAAATPAVAIPSHTRQQSNSSAARVPLHPPPAAPPAARPKNMAKVLYDFAGQKENELTVKVGELIEVVQEETNGKLLAASLHIVLGPEEGRWVANISRRMVACQEGRRASMGALRVCREAGRAASAGRRTASAAAAARRERSQGKPSAPQPPAKRPAAGRKPAALQPRDSGMSLNRANGSDSSRSSTPTPNLAGSLADACLRGRMRWRRRTTMTTGRRRKRHDATAKL